MLCTIEEILTIQKPIIFDESIAHYETHTHQPFASSSFNNNDEIRIAVHHQDLCLLPSRSSLHVYGRLTRADRQTPTNTAQLVNNAICHSFEEIRYELNAIEIARSKNVGLTTLMKNYIYQSPSQISLLENAGEIGNNDRIRITNENGYFDISIPLSMILGFAEDYRWIIINAEHELILTRANTDTNAVVQEPLAAGAAATEQFKVSQLKIEWMIPYIKPADQKTIQLPNLIAKDTPIPISSRTWELYEYPLLPATSKYIWTVKTFTQLEKPRYIVVGPHGKIVSIRTPVTLIIAIFKTLNYFSTHKVILMGI